LGVVVLFEYRLHLALGEECIEQGKYMILFAFAELFNILKPYHCSTVKGHVAEDQLSEYFNEKEYGNDVQNISLKLTIVNPPKGFEHLFKILPPKYIADKMIKNSYTNQMINFKHHFFCSLTIIGDEFLALKSLSEEDFKKFLTRKIVESLMAIDKLPKKVKNFDKERFKTDMQNFLKQ